MENTVFLLLPCSATQKVQMKRENKQKVINKYLRERTLFPKLIESHPTEMPELIFVIPAFKENELIHTIESLESCTPSSAKIEIIVVLNDHFDSPEDIKAFHKSQLNLLKNRSNRYPLFPIHIREMPARKGGVGYARKSGMDEALRRFHLSGNTEGVIICLDADCRVHEDYIHEIVKFYRSSNSMAAVCHYEHTLEGQTVNSARILDYELHLRLISCGMRWAGHPYALQTVGSTMTVRASAYAAQGGMNTRQAGEDFYFLQKLLKAFPVGVISNATVYPSTRNSDRVPFGTGAAMTKASHGQDIKTYHWKSYEFLKDFVGRIDRMYHDQTVTSDTFVREFLGTQFNTRLSEIRHHSSTPKTFKKRFFRWFDAFKCIKFFHFSRDNGYPDQDVEDCCRSLLQRHDIEDTKLDKKDLLTQLRNMDRYAIQSKM